MSLDQYVEIKELARQGVTKSEIARRLGLERHTVSKYISSACGPPVSHPRRRKSCLEPFQGYLRQRLAQGCTNGAVLLREIRARGYPGGYSILKEFLSPLRQDERKRAELRWESAPGQYTQVDWGHFKAELPDGSSLKLYAFVFTLAYSRVIYVEWTTRKESAAVTLDIALRHGGSSGWCPIQADCIGRARLPRTCRKSRWTGLSPCWRFSRHRAERTALSAGNAPLHQWTWLCEMTTGLAIFPR